MSFKSVKDIPLALVVEQLGGRYSHNGRRGETWWFSPFRPDERTASFVIHTSRNTWHDFARTEKVDAHGGIIDLWADFHNRNRSDTETRKQAWREIIERFGNAEISRLKTFQAQNIYKSPKEHSDEPRYKLLREPGRIWMKSFKEELSRRHLTLAAIEPYLKQAYIEDQHTQKRFNAFAFENDKGGFEISTYNVKTGYSFKNCIGPKSPTSYLSGNSDTALIFESFWDFLTWIEINKTTKSIYDFIIANGTGQSMAVVDIILNQQEVIKKLLIYQHNDISKNETTGLTAGEQFTQGICDSVENHQITVGTMNEQYHGYKDLNEWWMNKKNTVSPGAKP